MTMTELGAATIPRGGAGGTHHLRWRPSTGLLVLLFFFALTTLFLLPWITQPDTWTGGHGDEVLESWYLGWVPWAIAHGQNPLITHLLDYPDGVNVMWNTGVPLLGLLGAPVGWLLGSRTEYELWLTTGVALSAFFAYLFMRRRVRLLPAVLCGVIYGFSPFMAFHSSGHLHEAFAASPPLLLILFDDLLVRRTRSARRSGALLGLVVAAQLLIGEEILATELVIAPLVMAVFVFYYRDAVATQLSAHVRRLIGALAVAIPVAGLFAAAPLYVQFFGPQRLTGAVQLRDFYVTDLINIIVPTTEWLTPDGAARISAHFSVESTAYVSVPGLLLVLGTMVALRRQRFARLAAMSMILAFVLSLGPHLHIDGVNTGIPLPGVLIDRAPLLESILPARFALYVFLFLGVLVALGLNAAMAGIRERRGPLIVSVLLITLTLVALSPPLPQPVLAHPIPGFFTGPGLARIPEGSTVLVAPWQSGYFSPSAGSDATPMLWQQVANYRYAMPSGYALVPQAAGSTARGLVGGIIEEELLDVWFGGQGLDAADPSVRAHALQKLQSWRLAAIIVGPMQNRPNAVEFFTTILGRGPASVGGVDLWMGPFG